MTYKLPAHEIADKVRKKELSAKEVTLSFLAQIEEKNPSLNAFLRTHNEKALDKAKKIDSKKEPLGRLAGVPIAIKDNINITGELTTCGSKILSNFKAPFNATVIDLLEKEDAIIIGKTNLDEFAMGSSTEHSAFGPTKNPWNLHTSPGGSSGGSAAAVAARLAPLALGSDTGGSVRQPGALCGIYGSKPSYGRISRYGLVAFGSSFDQIGPFAHSAKDIALITDVMSKHCPKDSTSISFDLEPLTPHLEDSLQEKTFGVPWQFIENLEEEFATSFKESLKVFESLGAKIVDIDLSLLKYSISMYYILSTAEASTNLARFDGIRYGYRSEKADSLNDVYYLSREEGMQDEVKRRIMLGTFVLSAGYQDAYYKKAQKVRTLLIEQYKRAFEKCGLILMPTSPYKAFEIGSIKDPLQMYLADIYTIGANLAGLPAMSVPSGFTSEKLPIGLQIVGPHLKDEKVCNAAFLFEKETGYNTHTPLG